MLLLSLVLDTLCAAYMSYSEHRAEAQAEECIRGMWKARELLDCWALACEAFKTLSRATGGGEDEVTRPYFFLFLQARSWDLKGSSNEGDQQVAEKLRHLQRRGAFASGSTA